MKVNCIKCEEPIEVSNRKRMTNTPEELADKFCPNAPHGTPPPVEAVEEPVVDEDIWSEFETTTESEEI